MFLNFSQAVSLVIGDFQRREDYRDVWGHLYGDISVISKYRESFMAVLILCQIPERKTADFFQTKIAFRIM